VSLDCDGDTVLLQVDQEGPACHTGTRTCFDDGLVWTTEGGDEPTGD
jgi:phosphoribosyl-AMP cyclohydrolase